MFKNFQQIETFFENRKKHGIKPGLDRIKQLLHLLHNPQNKLKAIHVAGTNGKGSTINFIKSALISNGYSVGVFSSPSLEGLTGHIFINNKPIPKNTFIEILNGMYPAIQKLDRNENHPTEFEIITALAFVYFEKNVDFALIETGMGGREDTTNCFIPILSIITNIAKDHIAFLGDTVEEIAYHKAGIIKEGTPVIVGEMEVEALAVVNREAVLKNAPVNQFGVDFTISILERTTTSQELMLTIKPERRIYAAIQMKGQHQLKNAALALMTLVQLEKEYISLDWKKSIEGIYQTQVPGRFEVVHVNPTVIIDGAHNEAGIQTFIQTVLSNYMNKEKHLIFAGFKDKELAVMLQHLRKHFTSITVTTFEHARAAAAEDLYRVLDSKNKFISTDWKDSLDSIMKSQREDQIFFITGSLHFIAKVRKYFEKN